MMPCMLYPCILQELTEWDSKEMNKWQTYRQTEAASWYQVYWTLMGEDFKPRILVLLLCSVEHGGSCLHKAESRKEIISVGAVIVESSLQTINIWRGEIYGDIFCIHCQYSHLDHKEGIASPLNFTQEIFVTYTGQRYWNSVILYGCILINGIPSRFVRSKTPLLPTHIFGCWKVVYYW